MLMIKKKYSISHFSVFPLNIPFIPPVQELTFLQEVLDQISKAVVMCEVKAVKYCLYLDGN